MRAPLAVLLLAVGALADSTRHVDSSSARQALLKINGGGDTRRTSSGGIDRSLSAGAELNATMLKDSNATMLQDSNATTSSPPSVIVDAQQPYLSAAPTLSAETLGSNETSMPTEGSDETPAPTASGSGETPEPTAGATPTPAPRPTSLGDPPTRPHYAPPTERPTGEYVPPDDDPVKQEEEEEKQGGEAEWNEQQESLEQLERDQRILIALAVIGGVVLLLLICVAHQMLENPDGCCASICRIVVACSCAIFRCVCFPCRMICGCTGKERGGGHDLIMQGHSNNYTHDLELS